MNRLILVGLLFCLSANISIGTQSQSRNLPPKEVEALLSVYLGKITTFSDNYLVFSDGSRLLFDDGKQRSTKELIENPDVQDMFTYSYPKGKIETPEKFCNPGRIRNEE
jgi:hypothetical protein